MLTPLSMQSALEYDPFAGDFGDQGDRMLSDKIVKFRRGDSLCRECRGRIRPGSLGRSLKMLWADRGPVTYRVCEDCTNAMALAIETDDLEPMEARIELGMSRVEDGQC